MRCEEVRERLDDYVEGVLPPEDRAALTAHLEACAGCRAEAHAWRDLFARAAELPRSIEPARDLWPRIDAALDEEPVFRPSSRWQLRPAGLVAAALALVVLTAVVTTMLHREWDSAMARKLKGTGAPPAAAPAHEAEFRATTAELLRALEAQDLPPETMAIVQRNLAVIDVAIAELEAALENDPDNEELAGMLVSTYRKKAELLQRAVRVKEDG